MTVPAQADGALPEWAADLPPWAQVTIVVIVGGPALLAAVVAVIGAIEKLRRRREGPALPPEDEAGSPPPLTPELRRADAEMAALDRALRLLDHLAIDRDPAALDVAACFATRDADPGGQAFVEADGFHGRQVGQGRAV